MGGGTILTFVQDTAKMIVNQMQPQLAGTPLGTPEGSKALNTLASNMKPIGSADNVSNAGMASGVSLGEIPSSPSASSPPTSIASAIPTSPASSNSSSSGILSSGSSPMNITSSLTGTSGGSPSGTPAVTALPPGIPGYPSRASEYNMRGGVLTGVNYV